MGMGVGRLGFGQVGGGNKAAAAAPKKPMGGFGSVGPAKPAVCEARAHYRSNLTIAFCFTAQ